MDQDDNFYDQNRNSIESQQQDSIPLLQNLSSNAIHSSTKFRAETDILLIVHPTSYYDFSEVAKNGVALAVSVAQATKIPFFYFIDTGPSPYYFPPAAYDGVHYVFSSGGEHSIITSSAKVYLAGGYFDACLSRTLSDLVLNHDWIQGPLNIVLLSNAVYGSSGKEMTLKSHLDGLDTQDEIIKVLRKPFVNPLKNNDIQEEFRGTSIIFKQKGRTIGTLGSGSKTIILEIDTTIMVDN